MTAGRRRSGRCAGCGRYRLWSGNLFASLAVVLTAALSMGFIVDVPVRAAEDYEAGENIQVMTGLAGDLRTMGFTCIDSDYRGGSLFVADEIIPYSLASRYDVSQ